MDLRIPYAAVMVSYEAKKSLSMVHSYSRTYSSYEVEEGRTISVGREACWTLRDTENVSSFCVFHNGSRSQSPQTLVLNVRNSNGHNMSAEISISELQPYETFLLTPSDHFQNLTEFLAGMPGSASLDFIVEAAFTRKLSVGKVMMVKSCRLHILISIIQLMKLILSTLVLVKHHMHL